MGTRLTAPGESPGCSSGYYYLFTLGFVPFFCWSRPGAARRWDVGCSLWHFYPSSYASVLSAGKDIYPPAGHSPSDSRNQNPGTAGRRRKKKSRRRPPLPQVQVGTLRFRPPGDEIGPGRIRGASLGVSDWRRAVLRRLRTPRRNGGEARRPGDEGCRRAPVDKCHRSCPSAPILISFFPFSLIPQPWPFRSWISKSLNSQDLFHMQAECLSGKAVILTKFAVCQPNAVPSASVD